MTDTLLATQPDRSFSVLASAGTGKTWQLVARLTRLLLNDVRPDSILAITFTRKAAGEMQERLGERLRELLEADDTRLNRLLSEIGESPDAELRHKARKLLENWLCSEHSLRTTTFHSFCQDLLQRFPLEADLPPGFDLAEQTGLLITESWDALFSEATQAPGAALADALEVLFESLNGLHNTRNALYRFVEHRSDWWAFTRDAKRPVDAAVHYLQQQLGLDSSLSPDDDFWNDATRARLAEFSNLLGRHETRANLAHVETIENLLSGTRDTETAIQNIMEVFFTTRGERRQRNSKQTQRKSMGDAGEARFLQLHELLCEQLGHHIELGNRRQTLTINSAWYLAGQRMLEIFQRIKRERRLLDFADLEWKAWQLLNHPQHAHWVQYKLDQRIDHLLIDEFQDTNPTQWQLILPLLEEMAAGQERARSLFLVGDSKQSIYRFRRGNPRLLDCAATWMQQHLQADSVHLDHSWRSSPAVLDVVNQIFEHNEMQDLLPGFQAHTTHRNKAWGHVELWPLIEGDQVSEAPFPDELRNPLQRPRLSIEDRRHYREGQAIAKRIQELVEGKIAAYDDVLILMRSRTHLPDYESALRDAGIPYLSLDRGTLLQSLEVRDLEALLLVLMTPQDNLSLAQVLRSPVFSAEDQDLMLLAQVPGGSWFERLKNVAASLPAEHALNRAERLLSSWHALAGHIPIHDLLERIFHESNLLNRYQAAFPVTQVARVRANLTRFIELALEVDSGRYPTLPRFLERIRQLRGLDKEGPDQATPESTTGERVRLLTIHAAKGLEAPVVFLVDSTSQGRGTPGCQTLVRWPAEADRPTDFMLLNNTRQRDAISTARYQLEQAEEQRESANLLYVALTRAKHMLIITGSAAHNRAGAAGWYRQVSRALCGQDTPTEAWIHSYRQPDTGSFPAHISPYRNTVIDQRLRGPVTAHAVWQEIAPSRAVHDMDPGGGDATGIMRGLAIHRMLQLVTESLQPGQPSAPILQRVAFELQCDAGDPLFESCWDEVNALVNNEKLGWLFKPASDVASYNEVAIQYRLNGKTVYGIIDRLVKTNDELTIVDYKSHRIRDESHIRELVLHYKPQLALYGEGVRHLWEDRKVRSYLLFTDGGQLIEV